MCSFVYAGVAYGMGKHNMALTQHDEIEAIKVGHSRIQIASGPGILCDGTRYIAKSWQYQALATILYISTMALVKLSIGFFLLRISVQRRYIYILHVTMIILCLGSTAIFLFDIFQCTPVAAQWDFTIPNARCTSASGFVAAAYVFSVLAILSDWVFALLPIPMIWNVQMSIQAKCVVVGVLSLGIL